MVTRYGFSEKLGPVVYGQDQSEVFLGRDFNQTRNYSENVAAEIDAEIRDVIDSAYERAKDILTEHMDQLERIAQYLLEHEKVDSEGFKALMEGREVDPTKAKSLFGLDRSQEIPDQPVVSQQPTPQEPLDSGSPVQGADPVAPQPEQPEGPSEHQDPPQQQ